MLSALYESVRQQMTDPVLGLELLVPDEESIDLSTRVNSLAGWCDGFLFGLCGFSLLEF